MTTHDLTLGPNQNAGSPGELGQFAERGAAVIAYVGGFTLLAAAALAAPFRRRRAQSSLLAESARELEALLALGFPIVGLIHVGFGSIFAMLAFFRATFAETNGAVICV